MICTHFTGYVLFCFYPHNGSFSKKHKYIQKSYLPKDIKITVISAEPFTKGNSSVLTFPVKSGVSMSSSLEPLMVAITVPTKSIPVWLLKSSLKQTTENN